MNAVKRILTNEAWLFLVTGLFFSSIVLAFPDTTIQEADFTAYVFPSFAAIAIILAGKDASIGVRQAGQRIADERDLGKDAQGLLDYLKNEHNIDLPTVIDASVVAGATALDKELETPKG